MRILLCNLLALALQIQPAEANEGYAEARAAIEVQRRVFAQNQSASSERQRAISDFIVRSVETLSTHWFDTRWGRGIPQLEEPGEGKINCGTFVGTILNHAGFRVNVKKLQRQPSQMIIASFVPPSRRRKLVGASMDRFLSTVRDMGPGLFIIGLDLHVGLLLQTDEELRFIHSSIVPGWVVNEDATIAPLIEDSGYRVVGKLLGKGNIRSWLGQRRIKVKGKK